MHRQAITAQLGRGFPVLTGKYCIAQTGRLLIHRQRFSCFDRKIHHRKHSYSYTDRKEHHSLADVFLFVAGKYSTKSTVINAQAGKESTALMTEMLLRCKASTSQIGTPTCMHMGKDRTA